VRGTRENLQGYTILILYVPVEFDTVVYNLENWIFNPYQLIELEELYKE
jgi:hypothetical protein